MSRARRSLSSTASSPPTEKSRPDNTVLEIITGKDQNAPNDLEDGEITDEVDVEVGEVVVEHEASSDHDGRLDEEQSSESLERGLKDDIVSKSSTPDAETLKSFDGSEEHSRTDSSPHQLPTSSIPTQDVPVVNPACARANNVSSVTINSHLFPVSDEELELAKDVVLDLLGWGVQPEYLIECGISSHAIYRIFTDLHLRLPSNLAYIASG
ncbi:hypothetical protein H2248_003791 [Termitomyces sp. 'cryptogamus']|nr:hypothetical protein H2248_003791 [Termitomyces sp. 'cryptogamus']